MFDFAWSEIAIIGVVALVLIGPKDMPVALKGVTDMIKKARRMAGEFQTHVDEMMREADLGEVREHINEIRSFNIRGAVERAIDQDGSIRRSFSNPMHPDPIVPTTVAARPASPASRPAASLVAAGITPPPVTLRPGASPFEVSMPRVGPLTMADPAKPVPAPFPSLFDPRRTADEPPPTLVATETGRRETEPATPSAGA